MIIENLEQFRREIETFGAAVHAEYNRRGLVLVCDEIKPDEFRFAVLAPTGQRLQMNTVWYNPRDKKAEYCEGILRQHPPKDIS